MIFSQKLYTNYFPAIPAQNEHNLLKIKKILSKSLRKPLSKRDNFLILLLLIKIKIKLFLLNQSVKISFVNSLKQIVMISRGYVSFEREFLTISRTKSCELKADLLGYLRSSSLRPLTGGLNFENKKSHR